MIERVLKALGTTPPPGRGHTMAPALAYGRHRGPASPGSRVAAVALALFQDQQGEWRIPFTLRPLTLAHHPGQISLPGGGLEANESLLDAAIREFEEELGVRPRLKQVCGELATQYVFGSNYRVHPLVLWIAPPVTPWRPDPAEVADVIELPLASLTDPAARCETILTKELRRGDRCVGELSFRTPGFRVGENHLWGATAMILEELIARLSAN